MVVGLAIHFEPALPGVLIRRVKSFFGEGLSMVPTFAEKEKEPRLSSSYIKRIIIEIKPESHSQKSRSFLETLMSESSLWSPSTTVGCGLFFNVSVACVQYILAS